MDNRTPFLFTYPNVKSPKHYHCNIRSYWQLKLGHLSLRPLWKLLHTHSNGSKTARSKKRLHSVEFRRDRLVLKIEPSFQIFHRVQSKHYLIACELWVRRKRDSNYMVLRWSNNVQLNGPEQTIKVWQLQLYEVLIK